MKNATRAFILLAAVAALAGAAIFAFAPDAAAQCAMCRTAVAAGGERVARTMNAAMLVLLIPPVAIFCSIFAVVARGRKGHDAGGDGRGFDG